MGSGLLVVLFHINQMFLSLYYVITGIKKWIILQNDTQNFKNCNFSNVISSSKKIVVLWEQFSEICSCIVGECWENLEKTIIASVKSMFKALSTEKLCIAILVNCKGMGYCYCEFISIKQITMLDTEIFKCIKWVITGKLWIQHFGFFSKLQKSCLEIIISILEYFCMYVSQTSIILLFLVTLIREIHVCYNSHKQYGL